MGGPCSGHHPTGRRNSPDAIFMYRAFSPGNCFAKIGNLRLQKSTHFSSILVRVVVVFDNMSHTLVAMAAASSGVFTTATFFGFFAPVALVAHVVCVAGGVPFFCVFGCAPVAPVGRSAASFDWLLSDWVPDDVPGSCKARLAASFELLLSDSTHASTWVRAESPNFVTEKRLRRLPWQPMNATTMPSFIASFTWPVESPSWLLTTTVRSPLLCGGTSGAAGRARVGCGLTCGLRTGGGSSSSEDVMIN